MTDHPMQPSQYEFANWLDEALRQHPYAHPSDTPGHAAQRAYAVARLAYAAGADAELEACCEWLKSDGYRGTAIELRDDRRPKPPSLKQQVLNILPDCPGGIAMKYTLHPDDIALIRRAIEALPEETDA